jgi:TPR repeat protein
MKIKISFGLFLFAAITSFVYLPFFTDAKFIAISMISGNSFIVAQNKLGNRYARGNGVVQDYKASIKWYTKSAEQGFANAQFNLGVNYEHGDGIAQDFNEAIKWYMKAAEQGFADAQFNLGQMYLNGKGVPLNLNEAITWWRKAAEQGMPEAQYNLGCLYEEGKSVPKDEVEATKWYKKAAEQGFADAQFNLGRNYSYDNEGQDYSEAIKWLKKAEEKGSVKAQLLIGIMYENGQGLPKNLIESAKWFRKAAENGSSLAQTKLAVIYRDGQGVPRDYALSYMWFSFAAAQGEENASRLLPLLEPQMSQDQIAEAQRLAREWKKPSPEALSKFAEPIVYKNIVDVASTNEKVKTAINKLSSVWFKQDFQYRADKIRVVFIKSQSIDESGKFDKDCHPCGVDIAAVTYKQINNDWQLISKQKNIKIDGKFGDTPKIKQANIIRLTPNKVLFLITDSGLHQGYEDTSESLYLFSQNKWVDLGYIPSGGDYCFYVDKGHATKCYKFAGKISVIPSEKEYPDLLVTKTGTELDEKQNIIKAKNSLYIFKNGKYTEQVGADTEIAAHQAIKYKTQARDQAKANGTSAKAESMAKKEKICGIKANTYLLAADGRDNGFTPKQALGHMVQAKDEQDWKMKIDDFEHSGVPLAWMKEAINQVYFDPRFINARGNGFFMQMLNLCLFGSKRYEPLK